MRIINNRKQHPATAVCILTVCFSGCAIKGGAYLPRDSALKTGQTVAGELNSTRFWNERMDVLAGVSYTWSFGLSEGTLRTTAGDISALSVDMTDVYAGARYHPLKEDAVVDPYIGAGGGYYRVVSTKRSAGRRVGGGPGFSLHEIVSDSETVGDGVFPFILAGVKFPFRLFSENRKDSFVAVEARHDFQKTGGDFDFDGTFVSVGLGMNW